MTTALVPWFLAAAVGILGPFLDDASREARAGLAAYEEERWVDAVTRLLRAREAAPGDAVIDYDLGAAAFRSGDLETAARSFAAAAGEEGVPPGSAEYNLGNTFAEAGQLDAALEAYRAALRADPGDEDARHNYEVALARLEQQQEQEQQEPSDGQPEEDPGESEENEPQESDEREDPPEGSNQEQPDPSGEQDREEEQPGEGESPPEQEPGGEGEEPPSPADAEPGEETPLNQLTREQALRLLEAVAPEERELLRARLQPTRKKRAEKDW